MNTALKFTILISLLSLSLTRISWGKCPDFEYEIKSFNTEDYLGKWYEIARHKSTSFQKGDCTTIKYSFNQDKDINVLNEELINGKPNSAHGVATKTNNPFILEIAFTDAFFSRLFKCDYRVVDTDYTSYSLVYSCSDFFFVKFQFVWIISREPVMNQETLTKLLNEMQTKFGITKEELRFTNQSTELCGNRN